MTISISSVLGKIGLRKAPKMAAQEPLDEAGKFLLGRSVFGSPAEPVRSAKASAAFFNAQGMMKRGVEDQPKGSRIQSLFNSVKSKGNKLEEKATNFLNSAKESKIADRSKKAFTYVADKSKKVYNSTADKSKKLFNSTTDKSKKLFNTIKDTKVGEKTSKMFNSVSNGTKSVVSKPVVKKSLKFLGAAAIVLGALYLGKKAYDYYKNHKAAGSVDVKEGDNLWKIAKKDLGSKATDGQIAKRTEELMKLNNLEYANDKGLVAIKPGEKIKLAK